MDHIFTAGTATLGACMRARARLVGSYVAGAFVTVIVCHIGTGAVDVVAVAVAAAVRGTVLSRAMAIMPIGIDHGRQYERHHDGAECEKLC
jgi:hypothetical protein